MGDCIYDTEAASGKWMKELMRSTNSSQNQRCSLSCIENIGRQATGNRADGFKGLDGLQQAGFANRAD